MIDIGNKKSVKRKAVAEGHIKLGKESMKRIKEGNVEKGDVFTTAEIAGMVAVKKTPELIPHCHPIGIESSLHSGFPSPAAEAELKGVVERDPVLLAVNEIQKERNFPLMTDIFRRDSRGEPDLQRGNFGGRGIDPFHVFPHRRRNPVQAPKDLGCALFNVLLKPAELSRL